MPEIFKDKKPGDTLGAAHINKLNKAGRIATDLRPGAYQSGNMHGSMGPVPFIQRLVIVTSIPLFDDLEETNHPLYLCRPRYFDPTQEVGERWTTDTVDNEYDLDATSVEIELEVGDILSAWWDPQRGAYIPLKSTTIPEGTSVAGVSNNCSCGDCVDSGTVTACTAIGEAPLYFRIPMTHFLLSPHFGTEVILTHVSSCTWQSPAYSLDLGSGTKDYTWKLVFTSKSIEGAELTLEDDT